uniref:Uncharacterized protein n=1 Tax=Cannabis sativa TaxID=3483 RepID=A0A803QII4_CANSA
MNMALLSKLGWMVVHGQHMVWVQMLLDKYCFKIGFWQIEKHGADSSCWKSLLEARRICVEGARILIAGEDYGSKKGFVNLDSFHWNNLLDFGLWWSTIQDPEIQLFTACICEMIWKWPNTALFTDKQCSVDGVFFDCLRRIWMNSQRTRPNLIWRSPLLLVLCCILQWRVMITGVSKLMPRWWTLKWDLLQSISSSSSPIHGSQLGFLMLRTSLKGNYAE